VPSASTFRSTAPTIARWSSSIPALRRSSSMTSSKPVMHKLASMSRPPPLQFSLKQPNASDPGLSDSGNGESPLLFGTQRRLSFGGGLPVLVSARPARRFSGGSSDGADDGGNIIPMAHHLPLKPLDRRGSSVKQRTLGGLSPDPFGRTRRLTADRLSQLFEESSSVLPPARIPPQTADPPARSAQPILR
jgi:hypothetical protein